MEVGVRLSRKIQASGPCGITQYTLLFEKGAGDTIERGAPSAGLWLT